MNYLKAILPIMNANNLDALLITNTNEHLSEFISESDMRIREMTGFSGSNAKLVITNEESALFTDNRYFLQARDELVKPFRLMEGDNYDLIISFLKDKTNRSRVGIEQKFISFKDFNTLKEKLSEVEMTLIPLESKIFQNVWEQLPSQKLGNIIDLEKYDSAQYLTFRKNKNLSDIYNKLFMDKYTYDYSEYIEENLLPGLRYNKKIEITQKGLQVNEGLILTTLDSVAWLLNLRGTEISENTVFYAYVYITKRDIIIFTDHKIPRDMKLEPYDNVYQFLTTVREKKILIQSKINYQIVQSIGVERISENTSFDQLKSVKNDNEIAGFFQSALLDGLSLIKLFIWLSKTRFPITETAVSKKLISIKQNLDPEYRDSNQEQNSSSSQKTGIFKDAKMRQDINHDGFPYYEEKQSHLRNKSRVKMNSKDRAQEHPISDITTHRMTTDDLEIDISTNFKLFEDSSNSSALSENKLHKGYSDPEFVHRNDDKDTVSQEFMNIKTGFLFPSFANVVAYAQNGAIVHHSANDTQINKDSLLLIDSGSQYLFGTTDITRTISLDDPTEEQRHNFTLVLKGQILAKRFTGSGDNDKLALMIENLPKYYLLQEDKDYHHSTSHGIGTGLFVHESPPFASYSQIVPHQVFSIEPGFYREGHYGIRIEDAVISLKNENIQIQNMTFLPYQKHLIEKSSLTNEEIKYINEYHETIKQIYIEFLEPDEMKWLKSETEPL